MIRILCPFCHISLATHELEVASYAGHDCWLCPECAGVLVSEPAVMPEGLLESVATSAPVLQNHV